jgi:hypothetical protein
VPWLSTSAFSCGALRNPTFILQDASLDQIQNRVNQIL